MQSDKRETTYNKDGDAFWVNFREQWSNIIENTNSPYWSLYTSYSTIVGRV